MNITTTISPCDNNNELENNTRIGLIIGAAITGTMTLLLVISIIRNKIATIRKNYDRYDDDYKSKNCKNICKFYICGVNDTRIFVDSSDNQQLFNNLKLNLDTIFNKIIDEFDLLPYNLLEGNYSNITNRKKNILEKQCIICNENIKETHKIVCLKCNHLCHKRCLIDWIREGGNYCAKCGDNIIKNQ